MSKLYVAAIVMALLSAVAFADPFEEFIEVDSKANEPEQDYRLPLEIRPWNYKITLKPYLLESDGNKRFTFDGEVTIQINSTVDVNEIILHSKKLQYSTREYWSGSTPDAKIPLDKFEVNNITDKLRYTLANKLEANKTYFLHFVYNGTMDDDMHGFYRSSYVNSNNVTKWIGSTQFEPNHARRAFPSFDEPIFKATFDMIIQRHNSMKSFGNTRIAQTINIGDYILDMYKTTPRMSTYILAFIVSEFKERTNNNFAVIARPEYYNQTKYSYDIGQDILSNLSDYMSIKYYDMGNDKMAMAAIPDFSAGAMENWGLLTFRERALLYDPNSTTLSAKQSIASVIAHEQAHMWFGDLVTCDWWSFAWLNEGFARFFQYFGTAMVETDMSLEQQFVVDQVQSVMGMDSTNKTNPMTDENTNTPNDLARMFNSITYNKGASFIRMVKHAMGENNFQKSLQAYLKKYQYMNTIPNNLLEVWQEHWPVETKQYSEAVFKSFTEQVGYPVVHVQLSEEGKKEFSISQKRFLRTDNDGANSSLLYTIPITYTTSKESDFENTTPKFYLNATQTVQTYSLDNTVEWIICNIQETGYYRVNYDTTTWRSIQRALYSDKWSGIHELNRAQIVDDLLNLARASVIEYDLALNVLEYLENETNYLPWTSAFNGYSYLATRLGSDTEYFAQYILELTEKVYARLGFDAQQSDTTLDVYNRAKVLSWSCKYGNEDCISKVKELFGKINTNEIPVDIRSVVYCNALRYGDETDYDTLFNIFKTSTSATEQTLIISSLGCVKDSKLVEKYFWAIVGDDIRRQDKSNALTSLYSENYENVSPVFKLVTDNFEKLAESLGSYSSVATVISNIATRFTEKSQQQSLLEFNEKNKSKFGSAESTLLAAEKEVEKNFNWSATKLVSFKNYLAKRNGNGAGGNTLSALALFVCAIVGRWLL